MAFLPASLTPAKRDASPSRDMEVLAEVPSVATTPELKPVSLSCARTPPLPEPTDTGAQKHFLPAGASLEHALRILRGLKFGATMLWDKAASLHNAQSTVEERIRLLKCDLALLEHQAREYHSARRCILEEARAIETQYTTSLDAAGLREEDVFPDGPRSTPSLAAWHLVRRGRVSDESL